MLPTSNTNATRLKPAQDAPLHQSTADLVCSGLPGVTAVENPLPTQETRETWV